MIPDNSTGSVQFQHDAKEELPADSWELSHPGFPASKCELSLQVA
jgi:hypothetical protein